MLNRIVVLVAKNIYTIYGIQMFTNPLKEISAGPYPESVEFSSHAYEKFKIHV
jgi:hypothetical protein